MNKFLLSLILSSSISFAGIINGVAMTVNDDPITMYDIEKTSQQNNIEKKQAISMLVDKLLYKQLVKKYNISVGTFEINDYIEKLAAANNMDTYTFKSMIKQKYPDYSVFENEARQAITKDKLIRNITQGNLKLATDEDLRLFYEKNKQSYSTAEKFYVVQYSATNKSALQTVLQNPMATPMSVEKKSLTLASKNLKANLLYVLTQTKTNSFTPIFIANKKYTTMYITNKEGVSIIPFSTVKSKVFNDIMRVREAKYLKEYFEKQKLTADIKILR